MIETSDDILKERILRSLKKDIGDHWGCDNDEQEVLTKMYLSDLKGSCIPDEYLGYDTLKTIEEKFYKFLGAIRDEIDDHIEIYISPSYEDITTYIMILGDKLLLKESEKAWNFWYESEEKLLDEMYRIYCILLAKSEKKYECYTLTDADIQEIAEQKGISLEGIDLEDVIHYIKKGIGYALDNRDEIIAEAIYKSHDKNASIFNKQRGS